ncbi:hypothetical protein BKA67DRAFT_33868 [Truncatella angustata]|uniref:Uncharacterized protein n=1 Tax=Truncatella angustata TaxID=152316 RepID=A0A9P8UX39_9PEZI|nr:uncharacterized protein BKA67DRAFT_33868 [Truncatella angustata]KAH6659952.1 hypothetical protein BKA67DRAFT_33868 [Truncatella angustata]
MGSKLMDGPWISEKLCPTDVQQLTNRSSTTAFPGLSFYNFLFGQDSLLPANMADSGKMDVDKAEMALKGMAHSEQHYFNSYNHHGSQVSMRRC